MCVSAPVRLVDREDVDTYKKNKYTLGQSSNYLIHVKLGIIPK